MKYILIKHTLSKKFEEEGNRLISNGWKPQGGVGVFSQTISSGNLIISQFCHALVKDE